MALADTRSRDVHARDCDIHADDSNGDASCSCGATTSTILEAQLTATRDWQLIAEAAVDGLRSAIAVETTGIAVDVDVAARNGLAPEVVAKRRAEREARLTELRRALVRALAWNPISEAPRRKP